MLQSFRFLRSVRPCASPLYSIIHTFFPSRRSAVKYSIPWYQGTAPSASLAIISSGVFTLSALKSGEFLIYRSGCCHKVAPIRLCDTSYWNWRLMPVSQRRKAQERFQDLDKRERAKAVAL